MGFVEFVVTNSMRVLFLLCVRSELTSHHQLFPFARNAPCRAVNKKSLLVAWEHLCRRQFGAI
jgi:hypothetical protein